MSPRVAYWTSSFRPEMEAVAAEVATLRQAFPGSIAWGVSGRDGSSWSWARGFGVAPCLQLPFRAITKWAQRWFDVNHVVGSLGDWFHLRAVSGRPTVLTMAVDRQPSDLRLLDKVERFAVEWPAGREQLRQLNIDPRRIEVIFPPVDLRKFQPSPPPADGVEILFASSPDRADWLEARGVDLILGAAELRPDYRFRLVWRPWGDSRQRVEQWIRERQLNNVSLIVECVADMSVHYQQTHITVAPFVDLQRCKPSPNSLLESLAAGRPVVTTRQVGIAELVSDSRAGGVCEPSAESLAETLDEVVGHWRECSTNARSLAESRFCSQRFVQAYARLYESVL